MPKKLRTLDQVESMQAKAVRFASDVLGDREKADELDSLSPEDYAAKKHITISNPLKKRRRSTVIAEGGNMRRNRSNPTAKTKEELIEENQDLRSQLDEANDTIDDLGDQLDDIADIVAPAGEDEDGDEDGDDDD